MAAVVAALRSVLRPYCPSNAISIVTKDANLTRGTLCKVSCLSFYSKRRRNTMANTPNNSMTIRNDRCRFLYAITSPSKQKRNESGIMSTPILPPTIPIATSRMMLPDDTNPMGNVHGGTILKLIEQAGHIVASRHCNSNRAIGPALTTVLARVEHMDFHNPMYVGEVAEIQAAVTFTSDHSMEVTVDVWAENVLKCSRKHTNSARLWYVAISAEVDHYEQTFKPLLVPQLIGLSEADFQAGRNRYEAQKKARFNASKTNPRNFEHSNLITTNSDEKTIAQSRSTLSVVVLPSDCSISRHMTGGALMKIMDTTAGICAVRHCRSLAVTACLDAINFHSPIFNGDMVFVTGELVFTSAKSVVVEIHVEAEGLNSGSRRVTNDALFTFVALGNDGRAVPVPQLKLKCEDEERKFEEMKKIYEIRKKERLQHK